MKMIPYILYFGLFSLSCCAQNDQTRVPEQRSITQNMKLKITIGHEVLIATMYDNPTSQDFISMLPITATLEDYANTEKIFYPDRKLSTDSAPDGYMPSTGDITYYAPWGDIAIFYKDFSYAGGLISLGKLDSDGIEQLRKAGNEQITFELIKE